MAKGGRSAEMTEALQVREPEGLLVSDVVLRWTGVHYPRDGGATGPQPLGDLEKVPVGRDRDVRGLIDNCGGRRRRRAAAGLEGGKAGGGQGSEQGQEQQQNSFHAGHAPARASKNRVRRGPASSTRRSTPSWVSPPS